MTNFQKNTIVIAVDDKPKMRVTILSFIILLRNQRNRFSHFIRFLTDYATLLLLPVISSQTYLLHSITETAADEVVDHHQTPILGKIFLRW